MTKPPKRPRDPNQLAKSIVDLATMDEAERAAVVNKVAKKKQLKPSKDS
jgi:hypothetical protein